MKIMIKEFYNYPANDEAYHKGEIIEVVELKEFPNNYARYYSIEQDFMDGKFKMETIDWIPKSICEIIEKYDCYDCDCSVFDPFTEENWCTYLDTTISGIETLGGQNCKGFKISE